MVVVNTHINGILHLYKSIFTLHNIFTSLDLETISTHHIFERWVPYMKTTCTTKYDDDFDDDVDDLENYEYFDTFLDRSLEDKGRMLLETSGQLNKAADELVNDKEKVTKRMEGQMKDYFKERNLELNGADENRKVQVDEKDIKGLNNMEIIKDTFTQSIDNSIKRAHRAFARKMKKIYDIKDKAEHELAHVSNVLEMSKRDPKILKRVARKLDSKISKSDLFNEKLLKNFYHNTTSTDQARVYLTTKKEKLSRYLSGIFEFVKKMINKEKAYLKANTKVPLKNNYISSLVDNLIKAKFQKKNKKLVQVRKRDMPRFPPLSLPITHCSLSHQSLYRKFYILNEGKLRFCDTVANYVKDFQMDYFIDYLDSIRTAITRLANSKRTLYCAVCDFNYQKYFNLDLEIIYVEKGFCRILVNQFKEYFEWKDIFFVEYIDKLFQLIECYEAPGNSIDYPYRTMVTKHKRMIFFVKRCFMAVETENYFRYCHFICKHFKFHSMDEYLEGDADFLKTIYTKLVSFLRKQNIELPRDYVHEMKANYGRFIEYDLEHHDPETQASIDEMGSGETAAPRELKSEPVVSVYDKREATVLLKDFKIIFTEDEGMKPLRMDETVNFDVSLEDKIDTYIEKRSHEPINHSTIHLSLFNPKVIKDFNSDMGFIFDDRPLNFLKVNKKVKDKSAVEKISEKLNRKTVQVVDKVEKTDEIPEDKMTQAARDGVPEMDYIFE